MAKKPVCFVICPIGEAGSDTRKRADDLLEGIITPALNSLDVRFEIIRGDLRNEPNQIDVDVVRLIQESELCIADVSEENVNVYYEIGRRDETRKYIILMKRDGTPNLPVDMGSRRYIDYDFTMRGAINATQKLKEFIEPMISNNFNNPNGASISDLTMTLQRVERKLDYISKKVENGGGTGRIGGTGGNNGSDDDIFKDKDPREVFRYALAKRNVPLAEACLARIEPIVDTWVFYDIYVEQAAAIHSLKAGQMLIDMASRFFDESGMPFHKKIEYYCVLVGVINHADREEELQELVEDIAKRLLAESDDQDPDDVVEIPNQLSRLYFGAFSNTGCVEYLRMAIQELKKGLEIDEMKPYLHYNLAICYNEVPESESTSEDEEKGEKHIRRCLELASMIGKDDDDHLQLAYRIFKMRGDYVSAEDAIMRLRAIDPIKAEYVESKY